MNQLSLRVRLALGCTLLSLVMAVAGVYQIVTIRQFHSVVAELTSQSLNRHTALEELKLANTKLHEAQTDYIVARQLRPALEATKKQELAVQLEDFSETTKAYLRLAEAGNLQSDTKRYKTIEQNSQQVISQSQAVLSGTALSSAVLSKTQATLADSVSIAWQREQQHIAEGREEVDRRVDQLLFIVVAFAALQPILALIAGIFITRLISRSLVALHQGAERVANGDFSQPVPIKVKDEIGQLALAFNNMAARMKEAYRRLALESQRDEAILASMGEGLLAADDKGRIAIINNVAAQLLGFKSPDDAVGKTLTSAYQIYDINPKHKKPLAPSQRPGMMALKSAEPNSGVYLFKESDGISRQINISASPVILEDNVVGVVTILRDVTKEKEIDRMKTEFISLASHQLRTPLSAIKWFSEMLVSGDVGKLKPEQADFARNISESTERMIALVNALLNISRIESGRILIDPKPTDLRELVTGITNDLKAKTEQKQQSLIISVHEDLPKINLDPRLVSQVYLNLLTNAIKYTPKGGEVSVFISKKGKDVISQVTDNGYGIPKEQQGRVFQKFFRASNAVKVETDGTGLGLYLIKAVVESSGGKIWFESEVGKGTTFWFSLPLSGMKAKEGEVTLDV